MQLLTQEEISTIFERFKAREPNPKSELNYHSAYTLLVAVVLSAQTTDKSVNRVTENLFKLADTPEKMQELSQEQIAEQKCSYAQQTALSEFWRNSSFHTGRIDDASGGRQKNRKRSLECRIQSAYNAS